MLKVLQISTGAILVLWAIFTTLFYISAGAFEKEKSGSGYDLYLKYTPPLWKKITRWVLVPAFVIYVITLFKI